MATEPKGTDMLPRSAFSPHRVIGTIIMWPEGPDEDDLIPVLARITDWEDDIWEERDEEGYRHGGREVFLELVRLELDGTQTKDTARINLNDIEEHAVPDDLADVVKHIEFADRRESELRIERLRIKASLRERGRNAVHARSARERPVFTTELRS